MIRIVIIFFFTFSALHDVQCQKNGINILTSDITEERREFEKLLTDILLNSLRPYKCVAILCDQVYYSVFREDVFLNMGLYITYFIILIEDQDDLISPYPDTQESFYTIKRQDCQTYIILISNGIQMSRLLRFGDRYRVLDSRANYIVLYDNRLFEKELYYIWKRIINVIFIREYSGVKVLKGEKKIIPWFELSTVPFPAPIKGILVPRRLDIWRQNKFRSGADLFRDKTVDLRNQSVKVATFQHIPAAVKGPVPEFKSAKSVLPIGDTGMTGIEIEIITTVSQTMNFFPELYEPENADTEFWGRKQPDGQFTGMFGELTMSRADIGLGDFYYTPQILDMMDLTLPYNTECLTFLTPEAMTDNSYKTLILPFKPLMWLGVTCFLVVNGVIFYYHAKFHAAMDKSGDDGGHEEIDRKAKMALVPLKAISKMDPNETYVFMKHQMELQRSDKDKDPPETIIFGELINAFLYSFSALMMVGLPVLPNAWSLRVLTGFYWLYCLLVVVAYRASMTAILANPAPRVTIDTLQELVDSQLAVGGWGEIHQDSFVTSLDPILQAIGTKFEVINNTDLAVDRVAVGQFALYENVFYLKQASVKRQLRLELEQINVTTRAAHDATGDRSMHIMSNCIINMPISIGLQKNSPIKPRMDKFIRRVIEAGLIKKWLDDVMQTTLNAEAVPEAAKAFMTFEKFSGGLVALFVGYFVSTSAFIAELVYFHKVVKKHPDYDKYSRSIIRKQD